MSLKSIKGWRLLHLLTFETLPHPATYPTLAHAGSTHCTLLPKSSLRASLLECDREELCLLPVSLTLKPGQVFIYVHVTGK